jgi:hypothetical protein
MFYKIHIRTDRHFRRANAASSSPASFTGADELTEGETFRQRKQATVAVALSVRIDKALRRG